VFQLVKPPGEIDDCQFEGKLIAMDIRAKIAECQSLPTLPAAALTIIQLTSKDEVDMKDVVAVIEKDPALSIRVLRAVNAPFYGLNQKVSTVPQAVSLLGLNTVKALVLGFSLVQSIKATGSGFSHLRFWRRSMFAAVAARTIAQKVMPLRHEDCFTAALLMDLGMLILDQVIGQDYDAVCERAGCHSDLLVHETHAIGVTHAEVSGMIAEKWGLPPVLAIPMTHHHSPLSVEDMYYRNLSQVVWLGGRCADVFTHDHSAAESISSVRQTCKELYQMSELTCDSMLVSIGQKTGELAELFDVRVNSVTQFEQILNSASERLLELSLAKRDAERGPQGKRRENRVRRDGRITITPAARGSLGQPVQVRLKDLSASGIGFTHQSRFEIGSQFIVQLPQKDGEKKTLLYTVKRCEVVSGLSCVGAELASVLKPETATQKQPATAAAAAPTATAAAAAPAAAAAVAKAA
jgi:HD-like signal output (HDOD) protein